MLEIKYLYLRLTFSGGRKSTNKSKSASSSRLIHEEEYSPLPQGDEPEDISQSAFDDVENDDNNNVEGVEEEESDKDREEESKEKEKKKRVIAKRKKEAERLAEFTPGIPLVGGKRSKRKRFTPCKYWANERVHLDDKGSVKKVRTDADQLFIDRVGASDSLM